MRLSETSGVLLALDLGSVRTGVAACDALRILAYPVEVITQDQNLATRLTSLAEEYNAVGVVIGYPLTLEGEPGIAAQLIRDRAQVLSSTTKIPMWLVDERLSTAEAHQKLRSIGRNSRSSREIVDAVAAVGILELVMNALNQGQDIGQDIRI